MSDTRITPDGRLSLFSIVRGRKRVLSIGSSHDLACETRATRLKLRGAKTLRTWPILRRPVLNPTDVW